MIRVQGLYKKFRLKEGLFAQEDSYIYAVNGVSFDVNPDETLGLVGESGCGKSTTARLLVRMYEADAGKIEFKSQQGGDYEVSKLDKYRLQELRNKVRYIFQDPARSLDPRMSVEEILTIGYRYSGKWKGRKNAVDTAVVKLEAVGLTSGDLERRPSEFSGGQRQRISIARALMTDPEVLICDEVVSALDVSIQSQILKLLVSLRLKQKMSILFISHDLSVVSYISDRIAVMYGGVIVEEGASEDVSLKGVHPYTRVLYDSVPGRMENALHKDKVNLKTVDLTVRPERCLFADRCPLVSEQCMLEMPVMHDIGNGHRVACFNV